MLYGGERLTMAMLRRADASCERTRDMPILKEEIFAPILYLIEFDTLDEAIAWHNDVPQGLVVGDFHQ